MDNVLHCVLLVHHMTTVYYRNGCVYACMHIYGAAVALMLSCLGTAIDLLDIYRQMACMNWVT